jgi:phthalate 3,4-dioxygenase ferredoxin reductase subunit
MSRVAIVGASVAGVHVAEALRAGGFAGGIVIVGDESVNPYDKPALSKQMLTGEWRPEDLWLLPGRRASDLDVELHLGSRAVHLDSLDQTLWLADETGIGYDRLVLATGSSARRPAWAVGDGVFTLRTLGDSLRLRQSLIDARKVVVVGGGFIGAEVAAAARTLGCEVTVIDPVAVPLARLLGAEVGALFSDIHERHGVQGRFGVGVTAASGPLGDVFVDLCDGSTIDADLVVAGIGAVPNDAWLASSSLPTDDGVLCDEYCRVLGHEEIYAAGDVARWQDSRFCRFTRVEHWTNAVEQGAHVARNLLGDTLAPYRPLHYVWSDQYDWKLQFISVSDARATHEILGDFKGDLPRGVVAYGDDDGQFVAALSLNHPRALMNARRMLQAGTGFGEAVSTLRDSVLKHTS